MASTQETPMRLLTASDYEHTLSKTAASGRSPWSDWWTEAAQGYAQAIAYAFLGILKVRTPVDDDLVGHYKVSIPMSVDGQDCNFVVTFKVYARDQAIIVRAMTDRGDLARKNLDLGYYKLDPASGAPNQLAAKITRDFLSLTKRNGYTLH